MNRHHNHIYLVDPRSRRSRCYPLGAGCIYPLGVLPLVPSTTTLVTPRARVSLVAVLVVLVTITLVLVTLVLIPTVSETLVLVPLIWVGPFTPTLVAFWLLAVAHQVRWRTRRVVSFNRTSLFRGIEF